MVAIATPVPPASIHSLLANGQPAISCFGLSIDELVRRQDLAHKRADLLAAQQGAATPAELMQEAIAIGREQLWHTDFAMGLRLLVCDNELFRVTADLPEQLMCANGGQALDFYDYGYVADVVRDLLTVSDLLPGEELCLRRALAWAEQVGSRKRDYALE